MQQKTVSTFQYRGMEFQRTEHGGLAIAGYEGSYIGPGVKAVFKAEIDRDALVSILCFLTGGDAHAYLRAQRFYRTPKERVDSGNYDELREVTGVVYGLRCPVCDCWWKTGEDPKHKGDCVAWGKR